METLSDFELEMERDLCQIWKHLENIYELSFSQSEKEEIGKLMEIVNSRIIKLHNKKEIS